MLKRLDMKAIELGDILDFISKSGYTYETVGSASSANRLCSLYALEEAGLYYLKGEIDLSTRHFSNSIIITDRKHDGISNSNTQVIVSGDPQIVFYKLSQWLHPLPPSSGIH